MKKCMILSSAKILFIVKFNKSLSNFVCYW